MIWLSTVWPERGPICQRLASTARPINIAAEDESEKELCALGPHGPWFPEQRNTVGDRLDSRQRTATGGKSLQDEQHCDRLEPGGGQLGRAQRLLAETQRMDETDGDDREEPDDEEQCRQEEGAGRLPEAPQVQ